MLGRRLGMGVVVAGTLGFVLGGQAGAAPGANSWLLRSQEAAGHMVRNDPAAAIAAYTEALEDPALQNDRRGAILNDRGVAQWRMGQTKLAVEDFNRAVQLYPEYAATYNNRGSLLLNVGLIEEAVKDFDRAIVLSPNFAAAYNNRAASYLKLGKPRRAITDYTRAIELMPATAAPLAGRGQAFLRQQLPHAAIRDFSRAVAADARFATSYRGRAEAKLVIERDSEAIEDLSRAVAFDANNPEIYVLRGKAYLNDRNFTSAVGDFSRAIELAPGKIDAWQWRGLAHGVANAVPEALADINRALEINPRSAVAFAYRAWIYKQSQQLEIAQKDIRTAARLDPAAAEVLWVKGEIEAARGRTEQGIADLRRALSLKPDLKLAVAALTQLGAEPARPAEKVLPELGIDVWNVVQSGERYFAVNEDIRRLRIPLEMMGTGQPRLLEWSLRDAPLRGIGTLRFHAGQVDGANGPEPFEQVAIVDVHAGAIIAIEPHRHGEKVATWTWDDSRVTIASVDGVKDEFILRQVAPKPPPVTTTARRSRGENWEPFNPWNNSYQQRSRSRTKRKPKTLFDLIFGG